MVPAIQLTAGAQEEFYTPAPTSAPAGGIHDQLAVQLAGIAEGSLCTVAGSAVAKGLEEVTEGATTLDCDTMTFELEGDMNKHQQLRVHLVSSSSGGSSSGNCEDRRPAPGCTSTSHTTCLARGGQEGASPATSGGSSSSDAQGVHEDSDTSVMVSEQEQGGESEQGEECGDKAEGESGSGGVDAELGCYEQQSSDEAGSGSSGEEAVYCRNCTASIHTSSEECFACGHRPADDASLFAGLSALSAATQQQQQQQQSVLLKLEKVVAAQQQAGITGAARLSEPVALLWDDRMELHEEEGVGVSSHPERPDRVRAIMSRLAASGLTAHCVPVSCVEASVDLLSLVHTPELIEFVQCMAEGRPPSERCLLHGLSSDTYVNSHTYTCARLAAGGAAEVARAVAEGQAAHGAAIIRPPGHHAESNVAQGFCFFNNAAVAARAAQATGKVQRVLILDWDIHHGNGTQHIFEDDSSVMYMSLHRYDHGHFYPGTGAAHEVGTGLGEGYSVNVAWDGGDLGNGDYLGAMHHVLLPIAYEYNPDLILVSAGFDAAEGDPVGGCHVTPECFAHMTAMLKSVAPVVMLLEGGYNLSATATSTEACLRVLLGMTPPPVPGPRTPGWVGVRGIQAALEAQARYWRSVRPAALALAQAAQHHHLRLQAQAAAAAAAAATVPPGMPGHSTSVNARGSQSGNAALRRQSTADKKKPAGFSRLQGASLGQACLKLRGPSLSARSITARLLATALFPDRRSRLVGSRSYHVLCAIRKRALTARWRRR